MEGEGEEDGTAHAVGRLGKHEGGSWPLQDYGLEDGRSIAEVLCSMRQGDADVPSMLHSTWMQR